MYKANIIAYDTAYFKHIVMRCESPKGILSCKAQL